MLLAVVVMVVNMVGGCGGKKECRHREAGIRHLSADEWFESSVPFSSAAIFAIYGIYGNWQNRRRFIFDDHLSGSGR